MREEGLSYRETAERSEIRHKQVQGWERIYPTEYPKGFAIERRGRGSVDMHPVIENAKGAFLDRIDIADRKLLHSFHRQVGKADLTISLPCQLVEVIPRFIPRKARTFLLAEPPYEASGNISHILTDFFNN